ncbi:MAG: preprotein translocase subunit SecE [Ardenticatenia bacterium]|nr:preprotein translocase subunit SecE [Ardenticatenia bacterium]
MAKATTAAKTSNPVVRYVRDVRAELRKVTWPTREQAVNLTVVVTAVTVAMSLFLGTFDFIFSRVVEFLIVTF